MTTIERIFALMKQRGITQYRLSKDIGISESILSSWKMNTRKPSTDLLVKIAEYFNVSTDYLLGITANPETTKEKDYSKDETDLISTYRQLTPNSKQIVLTVAQMELRHIRATV